MRCSFYKCWLIYILKGCEKLLMKQSILCALS